MVGWTHAKVPPGSESPAPLCLGFWSRLALSLAGGVSIPGAGKEGKRLGKKRTSQKARVCAQPAGRTAALRGQPPGPSAEPTGARSCLMRGDFLFLQPTGISGNWQMWHSSKELGPQVPGSPAKCSCGSRELGGLQEWWQMALWS